MDKKTSDFLRHMFFLIFTDHEIKSPVVLLRNFLQSIFNGKLNYVFRQELNRSSFSFFVLEKRAKYGMMLISFEDLLPYQLPFPKSKPKKICVKMVKQICNCPHHMGICGLQVQLHPFLNSELVEAECSDTLAGLFTFRKTPFYQMNRILCGFQSQSKVSEKKYSLAPSRDSKPGPSRPQPSYHFFLGRQKHMCKEW